MFERFTESARRMVFFARYETSASNAHEIASEHLLLGLCRETAIKEFVPAEKLREKITIAANPKLPPSVDVPLTAESKRIFANAAVEAELESSQEINCRHLALAILREPESGAAAVMAEHGLTREKLVGLLRDPEPIAAPTHGAEFMFLAHLQEMVQESIAPLQEIRDTEAVLPEGWTRRQALGHLVDLALANYRWLNLPQPASVQAEKATTWMELLQLWISTNEKIVETAGKIPQGRWTQLRLRLLESYTERTEAILGEILRQAQNLGVVNE